MRSSKSAAVLAFIAGALLIIAGATGSAGVIGRALVYMTAHLGGRMADMLSIVLQALNFIASLGGVSVMFGGVLVYVERKWLGKFTIGIGAGMGLIGFLIVIGSALLHGWAHIGTLLLLISQSVRAIGVILAIIAIQLAR